MDIAGIENATFEAAIRRVSEAFGRPVGEISAIRADAVVAVAPPPLVTPAINYAIMTTRFSRPRRTGRAPRGKPSVLHEVAYAKRLVSWIDELRTDLSALARLLPAQPVRVDESRIGGRARELTEPVRRKVARDLVRLEPEIERTGRSVSAASKAMLDRQTRAVLGVEIPTHDERIPGQIDAFVSKNMTRIRSLGDKLIGEVEAIVIDAWDQGLSQDEVAALIEARIGVAESYARFIARDQMNALYSQVTRARHEEIGVRLFRWWTEDDGNVRESHAVKHGKVFPYQGSRAPSFLPGQDYGCRCWEEPVLDEIKAAVFAGRGRGRVA